MKAKLAAQTSRSILAVAAFTALADVSPAFAGTTAGETTISTSGSTALKNWFVKSSTTFTDIQPGTTVAIGGVQYPSTMANSSNGASATGLGAGEWAINGGSAYAYQLAPSTIGSGSSNNYITEGGTVDHAPAVRFEYHESGSVEGILEMANDQIAPVTYVTQNINRDPNSGNAVWVNYNQFGGGKNVGATTVNGYTLNGFYANGQSFTLGGTAQPAFNLSGGNISGGQNAVQLAVSDAVPLQVFAAENTATTSTTPWTLTPQSAGFGQGDTKLSTAPLGTASLRAVYQPTSSLNMPAATINPRTGQAFGTGAWNTAGLNNLATQTVATTATMFVANPGTGLTQIDRTDAQWLETTGRLQNGASFNMATRDVNSGTRNVSSLETGIDPTWSVGVNDDGNGNAADGGSNQVTIGPGLRFSNKTAGGNELRPTVQSSRMAVGTLSINDATGYSNGGNAKANPLRALAYSDSADGSSPYVLANYYTISHTTDPSQNPNGQQYTIFQNEQFVTLKTPDASYTTGNVPYTSAGGPNIQGDDATGDTKSLINNTLTSVATYLNDNATVASPAAGLLQNGFIIPQLMQVQKAQNGLNQAGLPSAIVANSSYNSNLASGAAFSSLTAALNSSSPSSVTDGTGSLYGANSNQAGGVLAGVANPGAPGFVDQISITTANYLFGNFNQTGVRDFSSVVVQAQKAQAALDTSGNGISAFSGASNKTVIPTGITALTNMPSQNGTTGSANTTGTGATKGDLIVLGDYNGDGVFDGRDLYDMAVGASLSDASNRPVLVGTGPTATIQAGTGTMSTSAANFGSAIAGAVLNKNVALDYLNDVASTSEKQEARVVLTVTGGTTAASIPAGATFVGNEATNGLAQYTFDPNGVNAFNKSDVNSDGVVDFNDAVLVDKFAGQSFTSQSNTLTATEQTPVTGAVQPANLVLIQQVDTNSVIGASDLAVINSALTGVGSTNWYNYSNGALVKTGSGTISWGRTGGTVTVASGAAFNVSAGTVHVTSAVDPFTDSSVSLSSETITKSVAVAVSTGATLQYTSASNSGVQTDRLASLVIATGGIVKLDAPASQANRTLLVTGGLTLNGSGKIDLGTNEMIVENGSLSSIVASIGSGIVSSATAGHPLTTIGVINGGSTFDGITTTPTDVIAKYTYYGDANLDGAVDGSDYTKIDNGFNGGLTGWANGDFNYDGKIDGSDYTLIDNAFNTQGATLGSNPLALIAGSTAQLAGGSSAVPEPTTIGLLGIGAAGLLARRRRAK